MLRGATHELAALCYAMAPKQSRIKPPLSFRNDLKAWMLSLELCACKLSHVAECESLIIQVSTAGRCTAAIYCSHVHMKQGGLVVCKTAGVVTGSFPEDFFLNH